MTIRCRTPRPAAAPAVPGPSAPRRPAPSPRRRRRVPRRRARRQEGIVLLSVMLIILTGTAIAIVTATDTRQSLRTVEGHSLHVHGRYTAEGIVNAVLGYFDVMQEGFDFVIQPALDGALAPPMAPNVPEPNIPLWPGGPQDTHTPFRVVDPQLAAVRNAAEVGPQAGTVLTPTHAYAAAPYQADLYDCDPMPTEGTDLGAGANETQRTRLRCLMTVHSFTTALTQAQALARACVWDDAAGNPLYTQYDFFNWHTASAVVDTVPTRQL